MSIILLVILLSAAIINAADKNKEWILEVSQQDDRERIASSDDSDLFVFCSNDKVLAVGYKPTPLSGYIVDEFAKTKLQNRSLTKYKAPRSPHPTLLQEHYRWEAIGLINPKKDEEPYQRAKHGQGCIQWHQLPVQEQEEVVQKTANITNRMTLEDIKIAQKQQKAISRKTWAAAQESELEEYQLFCQEILGIVTPITALARLKKQQTNCKTYLSTTEEHLTNINSSISALRRVLPLDLLQLLDKEPLMRTNLFSLLQIQSQQASINSEKKQEEARLEELLEREQAEQKLLQDGIINFDRSALSDKQLYQKAHLEKVRREVDANSELNATEIVLTQEEFAAYVFDYRRNLIRKNIKSEEELAIIQSACPKVLTPITSLSSIIVKFDESISKPQAQQYDSEDELDFNKEEEEEYVASPSSNSSSSSSSSSSSVGTTTPQETTSSTGIFSWFA